MEKVTYREELIKALDYIDSKAFRRQVFPQIKPTPQAVSRGKNFINKVKSLPEKISIDETGFIEFHYNQNEYVKVNHEEIIYRNKKTLITEGYAFKHHASGIPLGIERQLNNVSKRGWKKTVV